MRIVLSLIIFHFLFSFGLYLLEEGAKYFFMDKLIENGWIVPDELIDLDEPLIIDGEEYTQDDYFWDHFVPVINLFFAVEILKMYLFKAKED